ncbi:MAG: LytTR family DNA-binding domain-containing protein [Candidatus Acidiferrum sp.]|jgi:two-component system LytT family response regulator
MFEKTITLDLHPQLEAALPRRARIAIKAKGKILFLDPDEVAAVEARGNYVLMQRTGGSELLRESMSTVAEKLRAYGFVRIHRSVIVNASFVEEILTLNTGDNILRIKGGKEFAVSRTYRKNLRSLTPLWIGTTTFRPG